MAPKTEKTGQVPPAPDPPKIDFDPRTGIRSTVLRFDEDGYPGWWAKVRLNPRSRDMLAYYSPEPDPFWAGVSAIVLAWNCRQDDGTDLPLPSEGLTAEEMPFGLLKALNRRFNDAFDAITTPPKAD